MRSAHAVPSGINSLIIRVSDKKELYCEACRIAVREGNAESKEFFDQDELKLLLELAGDISFAIEHLEKSERLNYLAYYDELTGLANRNLFQERLTHYIATAAQERRNRALVVADLERFKAINDSLGRQAGDALLRQVAERMLKAAPDSARTKTAARAALCWGPEAIRRPARAGRAASPARASPASSSRAPSPRSGGCARPRP